MLPVPPQFYYYPYWASTPGAQIPPQFQYHYPVPYGATAPFPQPPVGYPSGIPGPPVSTPPGAAFGAQMPGPPPMYDMGYFMQMPQTAQLNYKQYLLQMKQQLADQLKKIDEVLSTLDKEEK